MPQEIVTPRARRYEGEAVGSTADRNPGSARLVLGSAEAGAGDLATALRDGRRGLAGLADALADGVLVPGSGDAGAFGTGEVAVTADEPAHPVDDAAPEFGIPIPDDWSPDDPTGGGIYALHQPTYRISPGGQCGPSTKPVIPSGGFVVGVETTVVGACFNDEGTEIIGDLLEVTLTVYAPA